MDKSRNDVRVVLSPLAAEGERAALEAFESGVWDHPALLWVGALHADSEANAQRIREFYRRVDRGAGLRAEALGQLARAQEQDGLKPYCIVHSHRHGLSTYVAWFEQHPNEQQAASVLDSEFEPEIGEYLEIYELSLRELCGVFVADDLKLKEAAQSAPNTLSLTQRLAQAPYPALRPIGTLLTSVRGERSDVTGHGTVDTGPMAEGYIESLHPEQEHCYGVVFPSCGVTVFLSRDDLADRSSYQVGGELADNEVVCIAEGPDEDGLDRVPHVMVWDALLKQPVSSGETLEMYGIHNLCEQELHRVGVPVEAWAQALECLREQDRTILSDPAFCRAPRG